MAAKKNILCVCPNPAVDAFLLASEIKKGSLNRVRTNYFPGGKGLHVALAANELGEQALLLGIWAGPTGEWLKEQCEELGVKCFGVEVPGWNRINYTLRSNSDWNETELVSQGPSIVFKHYETLLREFEKQLGDAVGVVMSGSWPQGSPVDAYGTFIELAKQFGVPCWVDGSGDLLNRALAHHPYGVHLNKNELQSSLPFSFEKEPTEYFLQFVDQVALTAGKDGLYLSNGEKTLHAVCPLEKIFSAVGSGDCLTAGLAVAHIRNYSMEETARFAAACGSANCLREDLGLLYRKDVEELLSKVTVNSV
jgi:tagatose 6-phosphate kinase